MLRTSTEPVHNDNPYDTSKSTKNGRYFIADELGVWSQD
jgi:hypothetical protein